MVFELMAADGAVGLDQYLSTCFFVFMLVGTGFFAAYLHDRLELLLKYMRTLVRMVSISGGVSTERHREILGVLLFPRPNQEQPQCNQSSADPLTGSDSLSENDDT